MAAPLLDHKTHAIDGLIAILMELGSKKISERLKHDGKRYSVPPGFELPPDFVDRKTGRFYIMLSLYYVSWIIDSVEIDLNNDRLLFDEVFLRKKFSRWYKDKPEAWVMVEKNTCLFLEAVGKPGGYEYLMGLILSKKEKSGIKLLDGADFFAKVTKQIFEAGEEHRRNKREN
jgi:hypothetical protein